MPEDAAALRLLGDLAEGLPPHLVLMRLLGSVPTEHAARAILDAATNSLGEADASLEPVRALWARHPDAHPLVRDVLGSARHEPGTGGPDEAVAGWAGIFDALAARHPEAGVALYALGDPAILAAATAEEVAALRAGGDVAPGRCVLDVGCGIGRLAIPLAEQGADVVGADISEAMLRQARSRAAGAGVALPLARLSGRDLAAFADASFDTVLAIDVFPYLMLAGGDLAARHVAEAARILRPSGRLVIANLSYRGDDAADVADIAAWAGQAGLESIGQPTRPFSSWDGIVFRLGKPDEGRRS